jgi:4-diphosphocytidyl-2-C-methyl-D-erythritol kinase
MASVHRSAPCKINLLLNVLGRRADGFHELETIYQPVRYHDELEFNRADSGVSLTCSDPRLPVDAGNLVHRATTAFLDRAAIQAGVRIHLEKRIPTEAGLGGGSSNAAHTLLGLNQLFDHPLETSVLLDLAAKLGSDVAFFLDIRPAMATGRGENVTWCDPFPALRDCSVLLVHPGFGVSTPWAYGALAGFPEALNGRPGRARQLLDLLREPDPKAAGAAFYNALEAPVLRKYPLLELFQQFFRAEGVAATLMSGSGSTTFALVPQGLDAGRIRERFHARFGPNPWSAVVPIESV